MKKVRITKAAMGKEVKNQVPYIDNTAAPNYDNGDIGSDKAIDVNTTLKPVPRKKANLEAEKGETAVTDLNRDGLPEFYKIGGKPHSKGGTPLNLPDNSFIFSNSKDLVCKDPTMLSQFGKTPTKKKKKYTPAELSLQYNINHYRKILADPNSDKLQITTAEAMIKNYMDKLGALALLQESKKGFDNGVPEISKPYLQKIGLKTEDIVPPKQTPQMPQGMQQPPTPAQPPMGQFVTGGEPEVGFWLKTDVRSKDGSTGIFGNNMEGTANLIQNSIFGITDAINRNNEGNAIQDELINKSVSAGFQPIAATNKGKWGVNNRMFDAEKQMYPTQFKAYTSAEYGGQYKYDKGGPVKYIDRIIDYELNHGKGDGEGLPLDQAFKTEVTGINFTGDQVKDRQLVKDYIKTIDNKYKNLPIDLRKRVVDFEINSENPKASLMVAAGILSVDEKRKLYPGGKLDNAAVDALYEKNKGKLRRAFKQDGFIDKFDAEKHRSYKATNGADVSYNATWGPRVDMWKDNYSYDSWTPEFANTPSTSQNDKEVKKNNNEIKLNNDEEVITNDNGQNIVVNKNTGEPTQPPINNKNSTENPNFNTYTNSSNKPTGVQNIPKYDENGRLVVKWDVDAPGYDKSKVQVGDYVKHDGRWFRQTEKVFAAYDGPDINELDPKLNGEYGDMREAYGRLVQKFNTDETLRKEFISGFNNEINNLKPGGNITQASIDKLKGLSDQEKIDYFLHGNKHHMMIAANMGDVKNLKNVGQWDKGSKGSDGIPLNYKAAIGKVGLNPLSVDQTIGMQSGYHVIQKMKDNPEFDEVLKDFSLPKTGVADDDGAGHKNISKIDGWEGNTSAGMMFLWKPSGYDLKEEEVPFTDTTTKKDKSFQYLKKPDTPYWFQDKNIVGNALYDQLTVKKRNPWTAMPSLTLPDPTFADFRGAAARLNQQAQSGAQQLSTFGNPQAFGAGFANIQKNNIKGITALQDQEYKTNLGIDNNSKFKRAAALNKYSNDIAALKTNQYDKQMIADQQYDNAKKAARWNTVNAINTAQTNRGMTQNINANSNSYYIDPNTGFKHFYPGDPYGEQITATNTPLSASEAAERRAAEIMENNAGIGWEQATKLATVKDGKPNQTVDNYGVPIGTMYPGARNNRFVNPGYVNPYAVQQGIDPYNPYNNRRRRRLLGTAKYGGTMKRKCRVKLPK